mgnify:CR=1 FL=1
MTTIVKPKVEALERLEAIAVWAHKDPERAHVEADEVLVALLRYYHCFDVARAYLKIEKI